MFHRKLPKETASDINEERPHEHGRAEGAEKTLSEGIREAEAHPHGEHLRKDTTPDEPGKPEAVNLERDEPVTTAARRRDAF